MSSSPKFRFTELHVADGVTLASLVLGTLATAAVYARLPERMATHFDIAGQANGWSSRAVGAFVLPAVALGTWMLVRLGGRVVPASWRARYAASPMRALGCAVVLFLMALHLLIVRAALDGTPRIGGGLATLLGVTWIALAILLPRVRRNPFVGIRTPWSLASDENWARTHHLASYTFAAGGVVALVGAAVGGAAAISVALGVVLASALLPAAYSWRLAGRARP